MAYESILTNVGRQKIASATPEHQLKINRLAVGDGNGGYAPLDPDMNSLVNEVWRGPASAPIRDRNDPTILIFEAIIPPDVGGFFIREAGIFDDTGDLIAVGHTAQIEKPDDGSGSPISLTVRFRVQLENADHFELIYNDQAPIDHQGITNRDAPDSHPISAITGLNNALNGKADKSTFVFAGTGLKGGGALSSNVTLSVDFGTGAGKVTEGNDERLSNAREWTAETVSQAEAEAGTSTIRRAWTAQRVRQAVEAAIPSATGLPSPIVPNTFLQAKADGSGYDGKTPAQVAEVVGPLIRPASQGEAGIVQLADAATAQGLTDAERVLTPATLAAAFQGGNQSLALPGYQKLPGGLILQWGMNTVQLTDTSVVSAQVNFPISFPSAVLCVIGGLTAASEAHATRFNAYVHPDYIGTDGFLMRVSQNEAIGRGVGMTWIALGR